MAFNSDVFPEADQLAIGKLDSTVLTKALKVPRNLETVLFAAYGKGDTRARKDDCLLTSTPTTAAGFEQQKNRFVNKAVSEAVENISSPDRIVELTETWSKRSIQSILIICPNHTLDFSANFYQPTKHFAGSNFNTLYFNLAVIWGMTIPPFITLYLDALKRLIKRLESSRKYRIKEK